MTITHYKDEHGSAIRVAVCPLVGKLFYSSWPFAPFIFINKGYARKLSPHEFKTLIRHDNVILQRQKVDGRCRFLFKYITDKRYRYSVEFEAYKENIKYLLFVCGRDQESVIVLIANILAHPVYGNMVHVLDAAEDVIKYIYSLRTRA